MYGVKNSSILFVLPNKNSDLKKWERERERDFGRVKDSNWENIESNLREFLFDNF